MRKASRPANNAGLGIYAVATRHVMPGYYQSCCKKRSTLGKPEETRDQTGRLLNRESSYAKNIPSVHRYSRYCLPSICQHIAKMNL